MAPSKPAACAIYARVSTDDQNCENQLSELRAYAQRMGWSVADEYVDHAESGAKRSRPALDRMMNDGRMRKFDVVVVWKLDRFARSLSHFVESLESLKEWGVRFVAPTQGIDSDQRTPMGRMLMNMLAVFAEFERDLIRERTMAGLATARAKGIRLGRPCKVFPRYKAQALRAEGMSWRAIERALGVPQSTIRIALKRVQQSPSAGAEKRKANKLK